MRKFITTLMVLTVSLFACVEEKSAVKKETSAVEQQQQQLLIAQPVPKYDWSLERHLVIQLYNLRNSKVATHSVWRSDYGMIEGDCPSMGFGIPYDTSLTNPLRVVGKFRYGMTAIEQPEPNGLYPSKNTSATWVMCVDEVGNIEPIYVESKVTAYPYPVKVDYEKNRVTRAGKSSVKLSTGR